MYKMRNHSLICIILLFFILIPFSFASDSNNLTYESKAVDVGEINVLSNNEDPYIDEATEGYWVLRDINLQVCSGEIVVIAGVAGNGQNELIESIAGLQSADEGQILLHGQDISSLAVRRRIDLGVALVPEQRLGVGLASGLDTYDNSILHNYFTPKFSGRIFLKAKKIAAHADHLVAQYRIDVSDLKNPVTYMSGGNLQKLLLGREIGQQPQLLLAAYPIRGLDVGAAQYLYNIFREAKAGGTH